MLLVAAVTVVLCGSTCSEAGELYGYEYSEGYDADHYRGDVPFASRLGSDLGRVRRYGETIGGPNRTSIGENYDLNRAFMQIQSGRRIDATPARVTRTEPNQHSAALTPYRQEDYTRFTNSLKTYLVTAAVSAANRPGVVRTGMPMTSQAMQIRGHPRGQASVFHQATNAASISIEGAALRTIDDAPTTVAEEAEQIVPPDDEPTTPIEEPEGKEPLSETTVGTEVAATITTAEPTPTTAEPTNTTAEPTTTTAEPTTTTAEPTTTTTTTTTTTKPSTQFDIEKFLEIVANLTYDYETNLTRQVNETLHRMSVPTCPTPTTEHTTTTEMEYHMLNRTIISKCFVCGLETPGIPFDADCADAFAGDFLPLVPQDPRAKGKIARFRKYCRYGDFHNYFQNVTQPRTLYGRWTGGCSVRWTDLSGVYTQRSCRNRKRAVTGLHYASKRMAKLEMALANTDSGCIVAPVATLLPLSRGISLFARFHACVCMGNWCNAARRAASPVTAAAAVGAGYLVLFGP